MFVYDVRFSSKAIKKSVENTKMGTIRCPKCRKVINENDRKCEYCGFDGIHTYVSKQKRTENEGKSSGSNSNSVIGFVFLSFIVLVCVLVIVAKWNSGNKKCKVCGGTGYYEKKTCVFCDGTGESDINPYKEVYGN